ncbi:DUF2442 domain-containing protein [Adhaeretor mobilis]|uniref:DUF2442 domain-containing protein n=1 Tax=Adhaeretor mobilis TaxID=1930276 RepID=A0A517MZ17_9BACT|nr:DUF2442 domain-containing protein [Adhaeretor mobilis]QDT00129.1 hypothetical protein HG15A2_34640 [Adhaeretor mobilis]
MQTTKPLTATGIRTSPAGLTIELENRAISIAWDSCSPRLIGATPEQRCEAALSPGGYGIHWPLLDEDLSIAWLAKQAAIN